MESKLQETVQKEFIQDIAYSAFARTLTFIENQQVHNLNEEDKRIFRKEYRKLEIEKIKLVEQEKEELIVELIEVWAKRDLTSEEVEELETLSEEEKKRIYAAVKAKKGGKIPYEKPPKNERKKDYGSGFATDYL